jgi:hypothetical protein
MRFDLAAKLVVFRLPIHRIDGNQKGEETGALDVPQKLQSESLPFVRAFDDAGNVGDDERSIPGQRHDAKVRNQRREGVIRDLGTRGGDDGQERRLAGVGLTYQPDIGDELELEFERPHLAVLG